MKVIQVNDFYEGGGAEVVYNKTTELLKDKNIEVINFDIRDINANKSILKPINYIYSVEAYRKLYEKLNNNKPDIIHVHNFYHVLSPSILKAIEKYKKKNNCKVIMTVHDYHIACPNTGFISYNKDNINICDKCLDKKNHRVILNNCDKRGFSHSLLKGIRSILNYNYANNLAVIDLFLTPSKFMKEKIKYIVDENKIEILKNPIFDIEKLQKIDENSTNLMEFDLVFVGRLSKEKGILKFIEFLKENNLKYKFAVVGDGEEKEIIKDYVKNNYLDSIQLLGSKTHEEALEIIKKSRALVLPSVWYENAPLSLIEAYIMNKPFFINPLGGMKEFAENHLEKPEKSYINKSNFINLDTTIEQYKLKYNNSSINEYCPQQYIERLIENYIKVSPAY